MQPDPHYATLDDPLRLSLAQMLVSMSREIARLISAFDLQETIDTISIEDMKLSLIRR